MVRVFPALLHAVATAAPAFTHAYREGDAVCSYAATSSKCALSTITPSETDGSVLVYPGGKTRCAFDDFEDAATGFKTNGTYFFQVFPKQAQQHKLLIYLQGGGACTDQKSCGFAAQCGNVVPFFPTAAEASSTAILNANDPKNLFHDWNIVYVPYCTGDMHLGNTVLDAFETGHEIDDTGRTQCLGQKQKTHLNGFENVKSALEWARVNYPKIDQLALGGSGTGALGAQALATYVGDMWGVRKNDVGYGVVVDSFMGFFPPEKPAGSIFNYYGACDLGLPWELEVTAACHSEMLTVPEMTASTMRQTPKTEWVFINSVWDLKQEFFYYQVTDGIVEGRTPDDSVYYAAVNAMLDTYRNASAHVTSYFVNSGQWDFLTNQTYYTLLSRAGEWFGDVVSAWISRFTGTYVDETAAPTPLPTTDTPTVTPTPSPTSDTPSPTSGTPSPTSDTPTPTSDTPSPTTITPTSAPTSTPTTPTTTPTVRPAC